MHEPNELTRLAAILERDGDEHGVGARLRNLARQQGKAGGVPEGWRCFHCCEEFTDREAAALHFGTNEHQEPACLIDLAKFREMEALQLRYVDEDADVHRAMRRMESGHQQALRRAEEEGYAKGLVDAVKYPQDATPPANSPDAGEGVSVLRIPRSDRLDPIFCYFEDFEPGAGRITVACFGDAWTGAWGAMGDRTVRKFVAECGADYLSSSLLQLRGANKNMRDYTARIAAAVITALCLPKMQEATSNG